MKTLIIALRSILAVSAVLALSAGLARADSNIIVDVNHQMIPFNGTSPMEVDGAVLVPLRGVFESLGAYVNYDPDTRTITASEGPNNVVLQLGSTMATVNGETQLLSQSARVVNGTTLVPLRFIAQSLGATVNWDEATSTVHIYSHERHMAALPPPPPPQAAPSADVTSFVEDASHPLRAGDVLSAKLTGTPGGSAEFGIPGVSGRLPMQETSPGVYVGTYTVADNLSVNGAAVLARLTVGPSRSPVVQANGTVTIDSVSPALDELSPGDNDTVESSEPKIYGTMTDQGGLGIDPGRVRVFLDGDDVTSLATVTPVFFELQPAGPLSPGVHSVKVRLEDKAGNRSGAEWSFKVSSQGIVHGFASDTDMHRPLSDGSTVGFTLRAAPGGHARFAIGSVAQDVPMQETRPGIYTGSYTVQRGQDLRNAPVTATYVDDAGNKVITSLHTGLTIAAGPPPRPTIDSPADGARTGDTLTLKGTTNPDATVIVKVDYSVPASGSVASLTGSSGTREVKADSQGNWSVDNVPLQTDGLLRLAGGAVYTVSAVAENSNGETSEPTKISVRP